MIHTIKGFVVAREAQTYHRPDEIVRGMHIKFLDYEPTDGITICKMELDVQIPDDWDPTPNRVKVLEDKLVQLDAAYTATRTEIKRQIQDLLAISMEVA